ncbi:rRNA methyltransferase 2 [Colletotrichum sp. SAR 10_70]|nr:rRNA methyltransferase 2 [Colletotrichum sp. SAR 10_71]KAI8158551.1 rRNA methyltransferase 2 [Colletotrichum sp. SAR 10_70]KAI8159858.1 rRNA methyltransferase 2 [Colletotrichum sp. SAR 10_65]KAI8174335.1 rRNA methyltransferase 2 [Colletotrichum sp. SAR 10_75]KAI8217666.1 rRNA methyltransferase 2 [Colletotrichum sp. SAR 10_77]KAI8220118.1 rRNA methyltransferase 2 [Colletotrichum sp. SAR 10_86]
MSKSPARAFMRVSRRQSFLMLSTACAECRNTLNAGAGQTRASSSNSRWKMRQGKDIFAREAKVQGLKSRAAFKLLEVAADRTKPHGQVLGIDIIPAQPPKGVSTIQGNFLSPDVQEMVKDYLIRHKKGRPARPPASTTSSEGEESIGTDESAIIEDQPSYIDMERAGSETPDKSECVAETTKPKDGRLVDIVLSDMSAPWDQTTGFGVNSLSNPYHRMMNTSGMAFRDHAGSMVRDLCMAALQFANDTLKNGGHFVCKFYQGSEDKALEMKLKALFAKVFREKPESSRSDSKEAYFVALRRKGEVKLQGDNDSL